jgi:hypothetical protein
MHKINGSHFLQAPTQENSRQKDVNGGIIVCNNEKYVFNQRFVHAVNVNRNENICIKLTRYDRFIIFVQF